MNTERMASGCLRLYHPMNAEAQSAIEDDVYMGKWSTIIRQRDGQYAVYVNGFIHSQHGTIMAADLALRSALGED